MLKCFANLSPEFKKLYSTIDERILKLEGIAPDQLDVSTMSMRYFKQDLVDMSIDNNANLQEGKSYGNYITEMGKSGLKLIGYNDLYKKIAAKYDFDRADKIMRAMLNGDLYFHDSTALQIPYCWAYSSFFMLQKGSFWGQLKSVAPRRARSFIDQVKEVTIELAQEVAGAVAIGDLFVCYSYFIQKDNIDLTNEDARKEVENDFQSLVHTLNKKLRPSHQSPFTNISIFDRPNLEYLFGDLVFPNGLKPDFDAIEEIQEIFCDWFSKGDPSTGLPYRFPVVTLNLRVDKNNNILNKKALDYYSKINLEKGCFNIYISSGNKIASCCRLINDLELAGCDSFGNGGISLGSHRVVTINLARLGKLAKNYEDLIILLKDKLQDTKDALIAHREILQQRVEQGFLPFFKYDLMHMKRLFSTFGISGVYECLEELGCSIFTPEGKQLAYDLLDVIRSFATECTKESGYSFNVEQVPAESLAVKFAAKDKILYDMDFEIYSNQFIPLWIDCDIVDRIKLDGGFSKVLTGGGISHLNLGEKLTSSNQMKKLIKYAVKCGCEHFAINYNFCKCENDHISVSGQSKNCPICAANIVEQYTRIIGYFTPVSAWNRGRQSEHEKRIFKENNIDKKLYKHDSQIVAEQFESIKKQKTYES